MTDMYLAWPQPNPSNAQHTWEQTHPANIQRRNFFSFHFKCYWLCSWNNLFRSHFLLRFFNVRTLMNHCFKWTFISKQHLDTEEEQIPFVFPYVWTVSKLMQAMNFSKATNHWNGSMPCYVVRNSSLLLLQVSKQDDILRLYSSQ